MNKTQVLENTETALRYFRQEGVKPTLRTLFYWLVSREVIPNTKSAYKRLSSILVQARKDGLFEWDFLEDKTRVVLGQLGDRRTSDDEVDRFEATLEDKLEDLSFEETLRQTFDYLFPSFFVNEFADQEVVPEIWIEKEALASTIESWLEFPVPIRVNRGYSSWTFIYNNVQSLEWTLQKHEKVIIYYLGDLDPSGVDIQRFLEEALRYFGLDIDQVELRRLAIDECHVDEYGLPPRPQDADTLAKLARDPRTATYDRSYIVELDALVAFAPGEFRGLVRQAIREHWDEELYDHLCDEVNEQKKQAKELLKGIKERARVKILEEIKNEN